MVRKHPNIDLLEPDRLLTITDVARILQISRSMIYLLIHRGDLPTFHIGHAVRFRSQDVQAYIRQADGEAGTQSGRRARRLRGSRSNKDS